MIYIYIYIYIYISWIYIYIYTYVCLVSYFKIIILFQARHAARLGRGAGLGREATCPRRARGVREHASLLKSWRCRQFRSDKRGSNTFCSTVFIVHRTRGVCERYRYQLASTMICDTFARKLPKNLQEQLRICILKAAIIVSNLEVEVRKRVARSRVCCRWFMRQLSMCFKLVFQHHDKNCRREKRKVR